MKKADTPHFGATRHRFARIAAALLALALGLGVAVGPGPVPPAEAASHGPGYDRGLGWLGAYREGGQNVYCLEQPLNPPLTTTASYAGAWAWGGLSADNAARLNWAISTYGQSGDRRWTAAVQLYVWSLADPTYNTHGMSGDTYFVGRAPASEQPLIRANLATIRAQAGSIFAGSTSGSATGTFQVNPLNNYAGTLTVSVSPSNMTGSLTLTNGIFLSTGTSTIAGVVNGQVLQVQGVPTSDGEPYKISATGTFTGSFAYGGAIGIWATPGLQTLGGPGPQGAPVANLSAIDPVFRVSDFVPVLTSAASDQVLDPGESFADVFTFAAALNPATGNIVPWLQYGDGTWAPVTASVTLYRVQTAPVPGDPIPADAEVIETFTITSSTTGGPSTPVSYTSSPLPGHGYYVAVSTIRSADQRPSVQAFLPLDYEWTDGWGVVAETAQLMDFVPTLTSAVNDQILVPGESFTDVFTFAAAVNPAAGAVVPWWQLADGSWAPVTASVTLYRVLNKPVPGDPIPADAEVIETFTITSSTTGGPSTPVSYTSSPLPDGGYYVAVSTIRTADQSAAVQAFLPVGYEWTDGWGVVSETAVLMTPGTSQATAETVAGHVAIDTVFLPSFVPEDAWIDWEVYERPDNSSAPLESDDTEAIDPAAVCTPATLYATFGKPVSDQVMTSPDTFTFEHGGVFDWVAVVRDAEGGAELWRAPCGVVSERTVVKQVTIVTEAQSSTTHNGPISDTALLNGTVLEGDVLTFRAYAPKQDSDGQPVCTSANLLWTSEPIELTAGVYTDEQFSSGETTVGGTSVWWAEELVHDDGTVEHTGECGLASETSSRPTPPLPFTGVLGITALAALGAGSVLAGAMFMVLRRRQRVMA